MKKIIFTITCMICMVMIVACGNKHKSPSVGSVKEIVEKLDLPSDGSQSSNSGAASLKNVNKDNCMEIAKTQFGIDLSDKSEWTLKDGKSPNGVNNLLLVYTLPEGTEEDVVNEDLFNKCAFVAENGVHAVNMDWNTGKMTRGDKAADYKSLNKESGSMWFYDYKGQSILFSPTQNKTYLEVSFVLTQ